MRDQHKRHTAFSGLGEHEVGDLSAGRMVEIAGRLVGNQQARRRRQGAGNGNALLLATGKFARIVRHAVAQAHGPELARGSAERIGMAGEFVIGMHGQVEFDGVRLAGLWPKQQLELVQRAGASIFGPCVNSNTGKSTAWNIARAITVIKPCMEVAEIPIHVNVGMGVGAVPTCAYPPADATSRAAKAFVEILKIDGY